MSDPEIPQLLEEQLQAAKTYEEGIISDIEEIENVLQNLAPTDAEQEKAEGKIRQLKKELQILRSNEISPLKETLAAYKAHQEGNGSVDDLAKVLFENCSPQRAILILLSLWNHDNSSAISAEVENLGNLLEIIEDDINRLEEKMASQDQDPSSYQSANWESFKKDRETVQVCIRGLTSLEVGDVDAFVEQFSKVPVDARIILTQLIKAEEE